MASTAHMRDLSSISRDMLADSQYWVDPDMPFRATQAAAGRGQVLLVAGENASGKSFFVETLRSWAHHHFDMASICISIRERTGAGTFEMAAMRRAMIFGDESEQSTGAASARTVETAFKNVHAWAADGKKPLLVLDEPEIGLSEGYACAMGSMIGQEIAKLPAAAGVVVVTHSRGLARSLRDALGEDPSFVKLGPPTDFAGWVASAEVRSVEDLLALREINHSGFKAISALTKKLRDKGSADKKTRPS